MQLTGDYRLTIWWKPKKDGDEPRVEVQGHKDKAAAFTAYAMYCRRIGKDVLAVRMGDHSQ